MPKLTNRVPSYRRHKASGQAIVTIAGKDHYLGPHGTAISRRAYDRLISEFLARDRRGPAEAHSTTIAQLANAYRRHAERWYAKDGKTTRQYENVKLSLRLLRPYHDLETTEFGPLSLKGVQASMVAEGLSRKTVNAYVDVLRRANIRSLNEQLREENQRSAAQRVLMAEREARTINAPLPKATARNRFMVEVGAFLKGGRYYELHTYTSDGGRTGLNTDDFVVVSDDGEGVHVIPKPYAGIEISDSSASRAAIRRRLGRFQANSVYVCFVVRKDSFAEFDVVRSVAVDLGLQYRVIPTDGEVVDRGGRDTKTQ